MSVVVEQQKKERIRVALQELDHPSCKMSACEAMNTLRRAVVADFDEDDFIGAFVGDDDFKEEIFSARVIQVVMDVSQEKEEYPPSFYHFAYSVLYLLCSDSTELATTFMANGGVAFLLESLETFSSDQFLLVTCFALYKGVIESLDTNESVAFTGMTLGKLVDVFQLNLETQNGYFYQHYCIAVGSNFGPGCEVSNNLFQRIVYHVWHGVIKHKHDEESQHIGRLLLCNLVGEESASKLIDHAEMHHCEDEECAACA
jgi:hypothetical protein